MVAQRLGDPAAGSCYSLASIPYIRLELYQVWDQSVMKFDHKQTNIVGIAFIFTSVV